MEHSDNHPSNQSHHDHMHHNHSHHNHSHHDHAHHEHHHHNHAEMEMSDSTKLTDYIPLVVIFIYISILTFILTFVTDNTSLDAVMAYFMGSFFAFFSLFKLLDLAGFAEGYSTYDIVAGKYKIYGFIYPFLEASLAFIYLTRNNTDLIDAATLALMAVSSIGVIKSLIKKTKIHCVCLGNILKVPLSTVSLFENLLMAVMALIMLIN